MIVGAGGSWWELAGAGGSWWELAGAGGSGRERVGAGGCIDTESGSGFSPTHYTQLAYTVRVLPWIHIIQYFNFS